VLNLFAYTGAATVAALRAGASVSHVTRARAAWLTLGRGENAAFLRVADRPVRWIVDDCAKFVEREIQPAENLFRRRSSDIRPPMGAGPEGKSGSWRTASGHFLRLVTDVLSDHPLFVLLNAYTTGLSPSVLVYLSESIFTRR
jgi:23S rRNA (cytosine1962-C5)-methyltransferase